MLATVTFFGFTNLRKFKYEYGWRFRLFYHSLGGRWRGEWFRV